MKHRLYLFVIIAILCLSGCGFKAWMAKEFMQGTVADGLSRLSVQHMSMIVNELTDKFESADAKVQIIPSTDPKEYGKGTVIWTLDKVELNHDNEEVVYTDCNGEKATWKGKAVVSATKTMYGRLTNNPGNPLVPDPGTVKIDVEADADNLVIRFPAKDGHLEIDKGTMQFRAIPRLAQNKSGMRVTPTSNTRFEDVKLSNMTGTLKSKAVDLAVLIHDSEMTIQVGKGENGQENYIDGHINIFGNKHFVPRDKLGLDPDYDSDLFLATYDCKEELNKVVSYEHIPMEHRLAPAVAGLTSKIMGIAVAELEKNSDCGFLSAEVARTLAVNAAAGESGALIAKIDQTCVLKFENLESKANCFGEAQLISGTLIVDRAVKTLKGVVMNGEEELKNSVNKYLGLLTAGADLAALQKDFPKAVMPNVASPVHIFLEAHFEDIKLQDICHSEGSTSHAQHCRQNPKQAMIFNLYSGKAAGEFSPMLAKDLREDSPSKNTCSIPTPISEAKVELNNLKASIDRDGNDVHMSANGRFHLINGRIGTRENELRGELSFGDLQIPFKSTSKDFMMLDAKYDRNIFHESFLSCDATIALPASDEECKSEDAVVENVARLIVMNAGAFIKVGSSSKVPNSLASFHAINNRELTNNGTNLILKADHKGEIDLKTKSLAKVRSSVDGLNNELIIDGKIQGLHGTMTRLGSALKAPGGILGSFNVVHALTARLKDRQEIFVRPISPTSSRIKLSAAMTDFSAQMIPSNSLEPAPKLILTQALMDVEARPIMGMDKRTRGEAEPSYSITTPLVKMDSIKLKDARAVIASPYLRLPLYVHEADLSAYNGRYLGEGNYVKGRIKFSLGSQTKPAHEMQEFFIEKIDLVPDFSQSDFNLSYAHTPHLDSVLKHD